MKIWANIGPPATLGGKLQRRCSSWHQPNCSASVRSVTPKSALPGGGSGAARLCRAIGFFAMLSGLAVASVTGVASKAHADGGRFDVEGYLTDCTSRVMAGPYHVPMDALCVSTAQRLCDLAHVQQKTETCLDRVSNWLEDDAQGVSAVPEVSSQLMKLPTPAKVCASQQVPNLSKASLCRYAEALSTWQKSRVVYHSDNGRSPDTQ